MNLLVDVRYFNHLFKNKQRTPNKEQRTKNKEQRKRNYNLFDKHFSRDSLVFRYHFKNVPSFYKICQLEFYIF